MPTAIEIERSTTLTLTIYRHRPVSAPLKAFIAPPVNGPRQYNLPCDVESAVGNSTPLPAPLSHSKQYPERFPVLTRARYTRRFVQNWVAVADFLFPMRSYVISRLNFAAPLFVASNKVRYVLSLLLTLGSIITCEAIYRDVAMKQGRSNAAIPR